LRIIELETAVNRLENKPIRQEDVEKIGNL